MLLENSAFISMSAFFMKILALLRMLMSCKCNHAKTCVLKLMEDIVTVLLLINKNVIFVMS